MCLFQVQFSTFTDYRGRPADSDTLGYHLGDIKSSQEEDTILINIHAPNIGALKYIKQILTDRRGAIDRNTIIVGDFNTPLTSVDRSSGEKISKATEALNDTKGHLDLIDFYRILHQKETPPNKQTKTHKTSPFFSNEHETFSWIHTKS